MDRTPLYYASEHRNYEHKELFELFANKMHEMNIPFFETDLFPEETDEDVEEVVSNQEGDKEEEYIYEDDETKVDTT